MFKLLEYSSVSKIYQDLFLELPDFMIDLNLMRIFGLCYEFQQLVLFNSILVAALLSCILALTRVT